MTALDTDAVTQKAVTQPKSYDIADIEYFAIKKVFPTGVMQPMDAKKIKYYDKIVPIFTKGKLTPDHAGRAGHHAVFGRLRRWPERQDLRQAAQTGWMTLIPTIYNADTLGIRPDLVGPADQQLEGPGRPRVQGQGVDPEHPVDRHHGRRDGHGVARHASNTPTRAT